MDCRAGGGCNDGDGSGIARQGLFVRLVEQSLFKQLRFQLLKRHRQIAHAIRRQSAAIELIGSVPGEDRDSAPGDGLHAVFRPEPQPLGLRPEHNAPQRPIPVLQRKIVVPGGIDLVIRQLAPDQDIL
ncbi:hypothetical protein SDC9_123558 [bioreactor metagenome]|uniref:Uncharacterized protein n=1 Tax=bioreactor metagenome TaxID=1076179 RepID=A0A645CI09_9ZZZZ